MTQASLRERALEELRLYAVVSLYLYACFGALLLYQDALMQAEHTSWLPHGVAVIKALVIGKFLLIGRAVGEHVHAPATTGVQHIVQRSLLLLVVVLVLSVVEELVVGAAHGRTLSATLAELTQRAGAMLLAKCSIAMLIILPLVALEELEQALGRQALRDALFSRRRPLQPD